MSIEDATKKRIDDLVDDAKELSSTGARGVAKDSDQVEKCSGWVAGTLHVIELVCPNPENAYRREAERIATDQSLRGALVPSRVGAMAALLERLKRDIDDGLLTSLADQARAEVFDDFLDHAEEYLKADRKNEAGVVAGVVFEDTVRRVCRNNGVPENGVKLDALISELTKRELLSSVKAKRARAAAGLRTSAAHARWDEFEVGDVKPVIELTRELISSHLDQ